MRLPIRLELLITIPWIHGPFRSQLRYALCVWASVAISIPLFSQGSTDYVPGKMYVIRITELTPDREFLADSIRPMVETYIKDADGMLDQIRPYLYPMQQKQSKQWFIGYFRPDRQAEIDLLADFYLLDWYFQHHNIQLCPLELLQGAGQPLEVRTDR